MDRMPYRREDDEVTKLTCRVRMRVQIYENTLNRIKVRRAPIMLPMTTSQKVWIFEATLPAATSVARTKQRTAAMRLLVVYITTTQIEKARAEWPLGIPPRRGVPFPK